MIVLACGLWVLLQWYSATLGWQSWVPVAEYGTLIDCTMARDHAAGGKGNYGRWRCVAKEQVQ